MTAPVVLQAVGSADLASLHALVERAYRGDAARVGWTHEADLIAGPRTSLAVLAAMLADPDERLLAVRDGGAIIACVALGRRSPTLAYLGMLTVEPARQGGGLGRGILAAAERAVVDLFGSSVIELTVVGARSELIAYYRRRGFLPTGEVRPFPVPFDPPLTLVVMAKRLGATAVPNAE